MQDERSGWARDYYKDKKIAENYDRERFLNLKGALYDFLEKKAILKQLDFVQRQASLMTALDIPCGTGRITEILVKRGFDTVGADISPAMVEVAQKKLAGFNKLSFKVCDILTSGFSANQFDCTCCIRLLQHLNSDERRAILAELKRITRAYIIINIPFSSGWFQKRRAIKKIFGNVITRTNVTADELDMDLKFCGLHKLKSDFVCYPVSEMIVLTLGK